MPKVSLRGFSKAVTKAQVEILESQPPAIEEVEIPWKLNPGPQTQAAESEADEVFYGGSAGGGKALSANTAIYRFEAPEILYGGWTTMGEVQVGDRVFDDKGYPATVIAVSEVMYDRPCYKLVFSCGSEIIADENHNWLTYNDAERSLSVRTTKEIYGGQTHAYGTPCHWIECPTVCEDRRIGDRPTDGETLRRPQPESPKYEFRQAGFKRYILSVTPVPSVPVRCIQVDSPSSLFLVGESMIPTHNSALLLILAATQHRRSIIFRRVYPNLKGMIEKSKELLRGVGRYNSTDKMWRGLPGDRTIEFGAMEYEDDCEKYRGIDHDAKFYDEATEITQSQFEFTSGWNRTTIPGQRCRILCTFNPPSGKKGAWIIKKLAPWLDPRYEGVPALPGELRWFIRDRETNEEVEVPSGDKIEYKGEVLTPRSRTFIPARLDDNPYLADGSYRSMLQSLPEPLRSQLLYGDFTLSEEDDLWQVIPTKWVRDAMARWKPRSMPIYDAIGVDVSRGGSDESILACKQGYWIDELKVYPGVEIPDGDTLAYQVLAALSSVSTAVKIDVVGVGSSPFDSLKRLTDSRQKIYPLSGGEKAVTEDGEILTDKTGVLCFENRRSEWWWILREMLDPANGLEVELPNDDKLLADLTVPRWKASSFSDPSSSAKAKVKVESKDEIKKRLKGGRSPDRGDAVVYAFAKVEEDENPLSWMLG